jgi:hypothetical protein
MEPCSKVISYVYHLVLVLVLVVVLVLGMYPRITTCFLAKICTTYMNSPLSLLKL